VPAKASGVKQEAGRRGREAVEGREVCGIYWGDLVLNWSFLMITSVLPDDIRSRIAAYVVEGAFDSDVDVLRAAMDALDAKDQFQLAEFHRKNEIAMEQSRRGESKPLDKEAMLARLQKRLDAEGS
jgi:Arc/MetJ-type ribon-helix-helix transcriptional regulator